MEGDYEEQTSKSREENQEKNKVKLKARTDIGFQIDEIKSTSTEDLINLRKSLLVYLNSKKLKKRNGNFAHVFKRISHELKERKYGKISQINKIEEYTAKAFANPDYCEYCQCVVSKSKNYINYRQYELN
jgi:hypothetical protein